MVRQPSDNFDSQYVYNIYYALKNSVVEVFYYCSNSLEHVICTYNVRQPVLQPFRK